MKPEIQRIAIAEACGWVREYADVPTWDASFNSYKGGYKPVRTMLFRRKEKCFLAENLPDYIADLNAMREAEKVLSRGEGYHQEGGFGLYKTALAEVCDEQHPIDATAAQRAEAFLRTLGKWGEGK
jgi:hypothetical protein